MDIVQLINLLFLTAVIIGARIIRKDIPIEKKYLYLMLFTLPWINERGFGPLELGFTIYPHYVFAFCFISTYLVKRFKRGELVFYRTPLDISLVLFIFVTVVSLWQIRYTIPSPLTTYASANSIFNKTIYFRSLAQIGAVAYMMVIYWVMVNIIEDKQILVNCFKVLLISSIIFISVTVFAFLMYLVGVKMPVLALSKIFSVSFIIGFEGFPRLSGLFTEPMLLGVYVLTAIPVPFCLYKFGVWRNRGAMALTLFIFVLAIFFTLAKSAYAGFLVALLISVVLYMRYFKISMAQIIRWGGNWFVTIICRIIDLKRKKKLLFISLLLFSAIITTGVIFYLVKCDPIGRFAIMAKQRAGFITKEQFFKAIRCIKIDNREATLANWGTLTKLNNIMAGILMWRAHPILGVGWGNYVFNYFNYNPEIVTWFWTNIDPTPPGVENLYVRMFAETGLAGFAVLVYMILKIITCMARGIRNSRPDDFRVMLVMYLSTFVGILVCYNSFSNFYVTHIWVLLALGMGALRLSKVQSG